MIELLSPYLEYKDSDQSCFGQIPNHWKVLRNGQIFSQRNQTGFPDLPILEVSLKTGVRVRNFEKSKRKQVMNNREQYKRAGKGDLAYNMMRMWQGAVGVAPVDGLVSPAYVVASPLSEVDSRYYSYLFRTHTYMNEVNKYSHGIVSDRNRLYWDEFKQIPSLFPPSNEQKKIADFLDDHGRKVSRLVRIKRRQIELLRELKQAIINNAVTRGLNSGIQLKSSGIDWIGDIPDHWEKIKIKHTAKFLNGFAFNGDDLSREKELPVIRIGDIRNEKVDCENALRINLENYSELAQYRIRKNDILIAMSGATTGKTGYVSCEIDALINQRVGIVRCYSVNSYFVFLCLQINSFFEYIQLKANGGAQENISANNIISFTIPLPPLDEQQRIIDLIRKKTELVDKNIAVIEKEIDLITEYRTSIISDVVTGKVDVRGIMVDDIVAEDTDFDEIDEEDLVDVAELADFEECEV